MKAHESYPKNKQTWVKADDQGDGSPTPHSGGQDRQLGGFDARERTIAQPNGVNRTPDIISRPGKHVPKAQESKATPSTFPTANDGPQFRSPAQVKIGWQNKGYLKSKQGK